MFKNLSLSDVFKSKRFQGIVLAAVGAGLKAAFPEAAWVGIVTQWLGGLWTTVGVVDASAKA